MESQRLSDGGQPLPLVALIKALERGLVLEREVRNGTVEVTRLPDLDHVVMVSASEGTTYWKLSASREDYLAAEALENAGIPQLAPRIVSRATDLLVGTVAAVGDRLDAIDTATLLKDGAPEQLGDGFASIHRLGNERKFRPPTQSYLMPFRLGARMLSSGQLEVIRRVQADKSLEQSFRDIECQPVFYSHGDARPANIFLSRRLQIIDWEFADAQWLAYDIATVVAHIFWSRMIPALIDGGSTARERIAATAPERLFVARLLTAYARQVPAFNFSAPLTYALIHTCFEAAASRRDLSPRIEFVLRLAGRIAQKEDEWRLALLPLDTR